MPPPVNRSRILDPRLGNIPANVLRNHNDRPVSITSPALEWAAIQAAAVANPFGRALYEWEYEIVQQSLMNQPPPGFDLQSPGATGFAPVMPLLEIRFRGL